LLSASPSSNSGETFYLTSLCNTPSFASLASLATSTQVSVVTSSAVAVSEGGFSVSYSSELPSSNNFLGTLISTVLESSSSIIKPLVTFPSPL
jgi:hypothetical protein